MFIECSQWHDFMLHIKWIVFCSSEVICFANLSLIIHFMNLKVATSGRRHLVFSVSAISITIGSTCLDGTYSQQECPKLQCFFGHRTCQLTVYFWACYISGRKFCDGGSEGWEGSCGSEGVKILNWKGASEEFLCDNLSFKICRQISRRLYSSVRVTQMHLNSTNEWSHTPICRIATKFT